MSRDATAGPPGRLAWLLLVALALHMGEEWSRFPEWATRHFGTTSPRFFLVSHVPIVAVVAWVSWGASRRPAAESFLWWYAFILAAFVTNALFHVATTLVFREYSPGLVTGVVLYPAVAVRLLPRVLPILGPRRTLAASIAGALASVLVAASLALDMPTL
jgi:hypothetical protein